MNVCIKKERTSRALEAQRTVERVRRRLVELGSLGQLEVRSQGQHILIAAAEHGDSDGHSVARLTPLGHDAFGLSFRSVGRWEPMVLVDTLDEVVGTMTAVIECGPVVEARRRPTFAAASASHPS